jgi:predicted Zn-dependent peptidase
MAEQAASEVVLANGMVLVALPMVGRLATGLTIALPAGSRHEHADEVGVAHLLEHLAFKGTRKHPTATELNRSAEYLGTELDGSATTEYVEFSTVVRAESAMPAAELLVELVSWPLLDEAELESERAVILQEIADADESLASRADDLLIAALFAGHRLAKNVAGDAVDVQALTHERLIAFRDRQWSPAAGLAVVAGNLEHLDWHRLERMLAAIPARPAPPPPAPIPRFVARTELEQRDGEVVHLRLAYSVQGVDFRIRRDRVVAEVFSQLIGGPMGSRLFDQLREQRALCYWVDGQLWAYEDSAFLSVSCSVRPADLDETFEQIQAIIADLGANGPSDEEAHRFSAYSTGAAALDFESVISRLDHATQLIMEHGDHDVDPALQLRDLENVTRRELAELAASIRLEPCIGAVGPASAAQLP